MEKRVLLEADIHEGGFEAVFEIADFAFEDAADQAFFGGSLDRKLLQPPFFGHGDAGFERLGVDDDFLVGFLDRLDQPLDFPDQGGCRGPDGFHDPLWLFLDGHRLKRFVFLGRRGGLAIRFAEIAFGGTGGSGCVRRRSLGWQARGDILGALDFVQMPVLIDLVRRGRAVDRVRASLDGIAVGVLLSVSQPAAGAKAHAAPPPGKASVTHN